jgi:putative ATPase
LVQGIGVKEGRELFGSARGSQSEPLAARMRPRGLDEYVGQDAILGPGRLLRRAIQADQLSSLIFYGPPGSGKTTLARVIANTTKSRFITINAVLSGIADLRAAIDDAKSEKDFYDRRTILFIDEVHRWNKAQQDALLPWVENGTFILIGATTENPYFEVNRALVSRSRIFRLERLSEAELMDVAKGALADAERGYGAYDVRFEEGALEHLVDTASGDARSLLNALELAIETGPVSWPPPPGTEIRVSLESAEESIQRKVVLYDRDGDYHYDVISAFIKSLRGSDPDAALYWLARMVEAGEAPAFIFRRMLVAASEDVGLAAPEAIGIVESCAAAFDRVGFPEGNFHLAHAALYLANCPKSNSALGFFDALESVRSENREVPLHLKDASRDGEDLGHGAGYLYPHAFRDHWVAQAYLPDSLKGKVFYHPSPLGWEAKAAESLSARRELQLAAYLEGRERLSSEGPSLPGAARAEKEWKRRESGSDRERRLAERSAAFDGAALRGNERVLVLNSGEGLFIWESLRRARSGLSFGLCGAENEKSTLEAYASSMVEAERPIFALLPVPSGERSAEGMTDGVVSSASAALGFDSRGSFESCVGRNVLSSPAFGRAALSWAAALCKADASLSLAEILPGYGFRPSDLVAKADPALSGALRAVEDPFYAALLGSEGLQDPYAILSSLLAGAGFEDVDISIDAEESSRYLSRDDASSWLSGKSSYGSNVLKALGNEGSQAVADALAAVLGDGKELSVVRKRALISARRSGGS